MIRVRVPTYVLFWLVMAFAALTSLAGCASPGHVAIETRVVRETVTVATPCVKASDIPVKPKRVGDQLNGDAQHDVSILAAYALRLLKPLDQSLALLSACTTEQHP